MEIIRSRRSHKPAMLRPDGVPREVIEQVLEAARWAPSHGQTEPWRFSVYTGEGRRALGEAQAATYLLIHEGKPSFQQAALDAQRTKVMGAPVWISLGMQPGVRPDGSRAMPEEEEVQAVACAVQNLHLMATALGLSGQWTSNPVACHPNMAAFYGLTAPGRSLGQFFLGYPATAAAAGKRQPLESKIRWVEG